MRKKSWKFPIKQKAQKLAKKLELSHTQLKITQKKKIKTHMGVSPEEELQLLWESKKRRGKCQKHHSKRF